MTGQASLAVETDGAASFVSELRSTTPLRLLAPLSRGPSVWAFTSSHGGGLLPGDATRIDVRLGAFSRLFLGTQASSKVYRNPTALPCSHRTCVHAAPESLLVLAPDPVQPFAESRYRQHQEFHLAASAGLVLVDAVSAGRTARGERWDFGHFESRNDVRVEGRRRFLDILTLNPAEGPLRGEFRLGRFNCLAMLLVLGPPVEAATTAILEEVAALPVGHRGRTLVSASPIQGGAILRIATEDSREAHRLIRHHLGPVLPLLGDDPWSRKW